MKKIITLLAIVLTTSLYSQTDKQIKITPELQNALKKVISSSYYYSSKYNRIVTENISFSGMDFKYELKIAKTSSDFSDSEGIILYDEIFLNGKIVDLKEIESDTIYNIKIEGIKKRIFENFDYYGPKNSTVKYTDTSSANSSYRININQNEDNSLYFIGTSRKFYNYELKELTLDELGYLRNEFYARKGFQFKTAKMKDYFSKKEWFKPYTRDVKLTEIELENVYLIRGMEQEVNLGRNSKDVDEINKLYEIAQLRLLTKEDLNKLNKHQLPYLRNTFFAKKGLVFNVLRYKDYFEKQNWYVGQHSNVDGMLTDLDKKNIIFIKNNE